MKSLLIVVCLFILAGASLRWPVRYLILFAIKFMAEKNFFFAIIEEGTGIMVMSGGKKGAFERAVMRHKGRMFKGDLYCEITGDEITGDERWDVVEIPNDNSQIPKELMLHRPLEEILRENERRAAQGLGGVVYLGLPSLHEIYFYLFSWISLVQEVNGNIVVKPHQGEMLNSVMLKEDVYFALIVEAEDSDGLPLNIGIGFWLTIVNPYKAFFRVQNWLETTFTIFLAEIRGFVSQARMMEIQKDTEAFLANYLRKIGESEKREFLTKEYGVRVGRVKILTIDPAGKIAEEAQREAATLGYRTEMEAKRIGTLANAESLRVETVFGKIKALGPEGMELRRLETLAELSKGAGSTIISIPELGQLFTGLPGLIKKPAQEKAMGKSITKKTGKK